MESFLKKYLGQRVKVIIDRPLGSKHAGFDMVYSLNYGYLPKTKAPDGEEIDAYILGVNESLTEFGNGDRHHFLKPCQVLIN